MHNFHVKYHIPKGEDGSLSPQSDNSISVAKSFIALLAAFSLAVLLPEAVFSTYSNVGCPLQVFKRVS